MSERAAPVLRWVILAVVVVAGLLAPVLQGVTGERPVGDALSAGLGFAIYAATGGLIIIRRDGHPTGWLLISIGLAVLLADIGTVAGFSPLFVRWFGSWGWTAVFALFGALTLTFPSGRLPPGPGWWARAGRAAAFALPLLVFIAATTETMGGPEGSTPTPSPVGFLPAWLGNVALLTVVAIMFTGAASLFVKRRRMIGVERAQLTWVVFAFALLAVTVVLTFAYIYISIAAGAGDPGDAAWTPAYALMLLFPLAFGVAVLRYRLYEIDRIISRTASYALLAGLLAAVFFGVVTLLTTLLPAQSDLAVAGSTLAVAALFNPFRTRLHAWVDRRFNRSRYDTQRVMDGFAGSLRDELDTGRMVSGWIEVVSTTMQPRGAGIWIRSGTLEATAAMAPVPGAQGSR